MVGVWIIINKLFCFICIAAPVLFFCQVAGYITSLTCFKGQCVKMMMNLWTFDKSRSNPDFITADYISVHFSFAETSPRPKSTVFVSGLYQYHIPDYIILFEAELSNPPPCDIIRIWEFCYTLYTYSPNSELPGQRYFTVQLVAINIAILTMIQSNLGYCNTSVIATPFDVQFSSLTR